MTTSRELGRSDLDELVVADDPYDQALLAEVHPPGWENPKPDGRYNLVVIGGGTAGLVAAAGAASLGAKVALIEKRLLGGDCLNFGCVPSKALLRSAHAVADARSAADFGVRISGPIEVDGKAVMRRVRELRASIAPHDSARRFRELGVDVFLGAATFTSRSTVAVGDAALRFSSACIATGARPAIPPIPGLLDTRFLTNETLFHLAAPPRRMAILGGGPIGCEMAQAFQRLGTEIFLFEASDRLLGREHEEAARIVARALERDGVHLHLGCRIASVERSSSGIRLQIDGAALPSVEVEELLVAVGRAPNVDGLDLKKAGVDSDPRSGILVDDYLRTTNRNVYAAGDVASQFKFTHAADALSRIVVRNALFFGRRRASALNVPWCTYTDPEVAHTGLTAEAAGARGIRVETLRLDLRDVDRAVLDGEETGFLEVRHEKGSDRIVGATLVARHAGEMISEISAVMQAGKGLRFLSEVIHPYPTQADIIRRAGDAILRGTLTPTVKSVLRTFLAWRR